MNAKYNKFLLFIFLISCNINDKSNCGVNFEKLSINDCLTDALKITGVKTANGKIALLKFESYGELIKLDTIIYNGNNYYILNENTFNDTLNNFFVVYSNIKGTTYGFVFYKDQNQYPLACLIENQNSSEIKLKFANDYGKKYLFSYDQIFELPNMVSDSIFFEDYKCLKYYYSEDTLNCQILENNIEWSASTPWFKIPSKVQNIYLDHGKVLYEIINNYCKSRW